VKNVDFNKYKSYRVFVTNHTNNIICTPVNPNFKYDDLSNSTLLYQIDKEPLDTGSIYYVIRCEDTIVEEWIEGFID